MNFEIPKEIAEISVPEGKILISTLDAEQKTHGGLILDPRHQDKLHRAIVLLVGPGKLKEDGSGRIEMQLKFGDVILFDDTEGKLVTINNKKFKILDELAGPIAKIGELQKNGGVEFYADTKF